MVPLLLGPVNQVLRTTTGIFDENSKQTPIMETRAAPFACTSHARKVVQAFPRCFLKEFQHRRKITKSNARAAARRLELSLPPKPCDVCSQSLNVPDRKLELFSQPSDLLLLVMNTFSPSLQAHTYHICQLRFWNKLLVLPLMKPTKPRDVAV